MENALLVIALVWLLAVTVLLAAVVRHLGALQAAGAVSDAPEGAFNFDTDGPWIPSAVPERGTTALARAGFAARDYVAVFFSAGCGTCLERAQAIAQEGVDSEHTLFLLTGTRERALDDLRRVLEGTGATLLTDPEAHDVVKALEIQSTPFAFRVIDGDVVGKAYLRTIEDFLGLASLSEATATAAAATTAADNEGPFELDLQLVGANSNQRER